MFGLFEEPGLYINHNCDPNLGNVDNEDGCYNLVAIRDIKKGEQLFFDYDSQNYVVENFKDLC